MADYSAGSMADQEIVAWLQDPEDDRNLAEMGGYTVDDIAGLAEIGYNLLQQGKLEDALAIYQGVYSLDSKSPWGASSLGCIFQKMERYGEALQMYREALDIEPSDVHCLANRGEIQFRMGHLLAAAEDLQKAVELDPHRRNPAAQRARVILMVVMEILEAAEAQGLSPERLSQEQVEALRAGLTRRRK